MINTNLFRRRRAPRGLGRSHAPAGLSSQDGVSLIAQDGVSLIEVMASALMVGFIVIATFTGFNSVNHTTADERTHDQAAQLAAQSLEAMRSDSAATLDTIEYPAKHVYTQTVGGEKYTITQWDKWFADNNPTATCNASGKEHSNQAGDYLRIATEVTWQQLKAAGRPALTQYSIITPPDGSGLEVDVLNGRTPEQPVAGVTVTAGEAEATTGEAGCVILGGIPATRITVESHKLGDVTEAGAITKVQPELSITPNITTHDEVVLNTGSYVTAEFAHEGKTITSEGKQVTGDTIVAFNPKMNLAPDFEVGSTRWGIFTKETGEYEAQTGTYEATAKTPNSPEYYPSGDLFPFEKGPWEIYAGDCPANNPAEIDPSQVSESSISVALEPGENPTIKVPTSEVNLTVYKGTKAALPHEVEKTALPVKITNTECLKIKEKEETKNKTKYLPNNAYGYSVTHTQNTTTTAAVGGAGKLEDPFQPFGKSFKLCLYDALLSPSRSFVVATYADEKILGPTIPIYLGEAAGKTYTEGADPTVEVKAGNVC